MASDDFDRDGFDDDLIEIERATAELHQRDPNEAERVVAEALQREASLKKLQADAEAAERALAKKKRIRKLRLMIVGATGAAVLALAIPLTFAVMREARRSKNLQGALGATRAGVAQLGFTPANEWLDVPPAGLVIDTTAGTCSAISGVGEDSREPLRLRLERKGAEPVEASAGLVWCSCQADSVKVTLVESPDVRIAMQHLVAPMEKVGGIEVLSAREVSGYTVSSDEKAYGCAYAAFEKWASDGVQARLTEIDEVSKPIADKAQKEGAKAEGILAASGRVGVVASQEDQCFLALPQGEKSPVTLRDEEGRRVVEKSADAIGWCSHKKGRRYSLWRETLSKGTLLVLSAKASKVGGLTGIGEMARRYGATTFVPSIADEELTDDAIAALTASGIAVSSIVRAEAQGLPGNVDSRAVAFSRFEAGSYLPDVSPKVAHACIPEPTTEAYLQAYVCVQEKAQHWAAEGAADKQGAAEGRLPFWLTVLSDSPGEEVQRVSAKLLAFARRMTLMGFQPTTTEGLKDTSTGATILARREPSQVVAVGVTKESPWIHPLYQDKPWTIEGDIPIVSVPEDKTVELKAETSLGEAGDARRVIVWRK